jgi:DNA topoisomerase-1
MKKSLVIVESPAKARTIGKYLGEEFRIEASKGHVRDLPEKRFGVDVNQQFAPEYEILPGREKIVEHLRKAAKQADKIYLAPDPDREGEAIAWHIAELLGVRDNCFRATFNEVTKRAIQEAIRNPGHLDSNLIDAQQARRILDRLVGYKISPLLGRKLGWGLSAGRVQSVAVRLVVERERDIRSFKPEEYWSIEARALASQPPPFMVKLSSVAGKKAEIKTREQAHAIVEAVKGKLFTVQAVDKREVRRKAPPPFITSTLQQEAARKLRMTANKTMQVAQRLYEGVELGAEGAVGLITYMRTDSVRLSREAIEAARGFIHQQFGAAYVPETANIYRSGKAAQEAHEAVRPTDLSWTPERVANFLSKDELALYRLIWNRFLASQMAPALLEQTRVDSSPDDGYHVFSATGQVIRFPGFLALYVEGKDEEDENGRSGDEKPATEADTKEERLPSVSVGEKLTIEKIDPLQHFTKPPARFTEASLVRELERLGIGRPSTYATIVSTIQNKKYVIKEKGQFKPTQTGEVVTDLLIQSFPEIMDVNFTAQMESRLDDVEQGRLEWIQVLNDFYGTFSTRLKEAEAHIKRAKSETIETDFVCPTCGKKMVLRVGRNGRFLACADWPQCKTTQDVEVDAEGQVQLTSPLVAPQEFPPCDKCGRPMHLKRSRKGNFLACTGYPECKNAMDCEILPDGKVRPIPKARLAHEVACAQCARPMVLKNGRRGMFLSCSGYPDCKSTMNVIAGADGLLHPLVEEHRQKAASAEGGGEAAAGATAATPTRGYSASVPAPPEIKCEKCGRPMVVRRGRFGPFFACTGYPECKTIQSVPKGMKVDLPELPPRPKPVATDVPCPECGAPMVMRTSKRGPFLGCSKYPKCKGTQPMTPEIQQQIEARKKDNAQQ